MDSLGGVQFGGHTRWFEASDVTYYLRTYPEVRVVFLWQWVGSAQLRGLSGCPDSFREGVHYVRRRERTTRSVSSRLSSEQRAEPQKTPPLRGYPGMRAGALFIVVTGWVKVSPRVCAGQRRFDWYKSEDLSF